MRSYFIRSVLLSRRVLERNGDGLHDLCRFLINSRVSGPALAIKRRGACAAAGGADMWTCQRAISTGRPAVFTVAPVNSTGAHVIFTDTPAPQTRRRVIFTCTLSGFDGSAAFLGYAQVIFTGAHAVVAGAPVNSTCASNNFARTAMVRRSRARRLPASAWIRVQAFRQLPADL